MKSEIKPALETWEHGYESRTSALMVEPWTDGGGKLSIYIADAVPVYEEYGEIEGHADAGVELSPADRHATAALCLRGMPFGFTWEDVAMLRELANGRGDPDPDICTSLADRLASLLPPRES